MTTEQRAEELESRVGSVEHMNLLLQQTAAAAAGGGAATSTAASSFGSQSSSVVMAGGGGGPMPPQPPPRSGRPLPGGQPVAPPVVPSGASSFDTSSPPLSGRSTPKVNSHGGRGQQQQQDPYMHKYHTVRRSKSR